MAGVGFLRLGNRQLEQRLASPARTPRAVVGEGSVCVLTRFELRHPIDLVRTYVDYRGVVRDARERVGSELIHAAFAIENLRTCYTISIWQSEQAIAEFGTDGSLHTAAAQRMFRRLARDHKGRQQLWSTRWELTTASHNLEWRHTRRPRAAAEIG